MGLRRLFRRRKRLRVSPHFLPDWAVTDRLKRFHREHERVEGWFAPHDMLVWDALLEFQDAEKIDGHMLEIGVFKGRSAYFSALFAGPRDDCWFLDIALDPEFEATMKAAMPERAHFLERSSFDVGKELDDHIDGAGSFRWIHIDGQHTALAVVNDLEIADRLLAERGVVVMDDFLSPTWPHVAAGVFRYLDKNPGRLELVLTAYNKGYLTRPGAVAFYQRFLRRDLAGHFATRRFEDFTMVESNLLDANDGLHCLGLGRRFDDTAFLQYDNRIGPHPADDA